MNKEKQKMIDLIIQVIREKKLIEDLSSTELKLIQPFLNALVTKSVIAFDSWAATKAEQNFDSFILTDFSYSGVLVCKGSINWRTGDSAYAPHAFLWSDYGKTWAFKEEDIEGEVLEANA